MRSTVTLLVIILASLCTSFYSTAQTKYCTPKYSGLGNPTSGQATPFYTHFLKVSISEIDRNTTEPTSVYYSGVYDDFTASDTARLTQTAKYPLNIALGNGANTQTFAVWIDFNQNKTFESTELVASRTDVANVGNHNYSFTVTIPKNAVLGFTRMRVGTLYGNKVPDPCNNSRADNFPAQIADWAQHFQDYAIEIVKPNIQLFKSLDVSHPSFDEIEIGSYDNEILRIDVTTNPDGVISPLTVDTFFLSLMGTTDPKDIAKAKLYYTGKNPEFATNNLVDTLSRPGLEFSLGSNVELRQGTNFFWLALDVRNTALLSSKVDARCNGIHVITRRVPKTVSPFGDRPLGYCISKGNRSMFVYVRRVNFGNINLYSTYNTTGYADYTNRSTEVARGDSMQLVVEIGNGVNNSNTRVWIDFNADGDFHDAGELVLADSISNASPTNFTYGPVLAMVQVPTNANVGPTRMRVSTGSKADMAPWKPAPQACDRTVEIGEVEDYTIYITDEGEPVASFVYSTVCAGDSTEFSDRSFTYNTTFYSISSWSWDFGDGQTANTANPKHRYAKAGTYKVRLVVNTNKPGTPDTAYAIVRVEDPDVRFSMSTVLSGTEIRFTDQTRDADVVFWEWNFGDPSSPVNQAFGPTPSFEYAKEGTYYVKLKVQTQGGCADSVLKAVKIVDELAPIANFNANDFEPYKTAPTYLVDLSVNRPNKWTWRIAPKTHTFLQGTTTASQNPIVSFDDKTTYTVTLVVENGAGIDSLSRTFSAKDYSKPSVEFTANQTQVKAGQIVSFLDQSTNDPTTYEWVFGDGDTSQVDNPLHQYDLTGKYTVKLSVSNPAGKDSKTKVDFIEVSDEYNMCESDVTFSPLFNGVLYDSGGKKGRYGNSEGCAFVIQPSCAGPITLAFTEFALNLNDFVKVFDYDVVSGTKVPLHNGSGFTGFVKPANLKSVLGAVMVEMTTDRAGDSSGFKLVWSASPNVKPEAKIAADTIGYVNSAMIIENKTVVGTANTYYWDTDNDGVFDDTNATFVSVMFAQRGQHAVRMVAQNCKGSDTVYHYVRVDSATSVPQSRFYANDTILYVNDEVKFFDLSTQGPNSWAWTVSGDPFNYMFVNGTNKGSRNPEIAFFEPGYYTIRLTASNDLGSGSQLTKPKYILVETRREMCVYPFRDEAPGGRLTDDGGENLVYSSTGCDFLLKPCAKEIVVRFKEFDYRPGDYLRVYDGEDATGTPLHTGSGFTNGYTPLSLTLIAKSGAMYFEHRATGFNSSFQGFVADWSSVPYDEPVLDFELPDTAYTGGNVVFFFDRTDDKGNDQLKWKWDFDNNGKVDDTLANPHYSYAKVGNYNVEMRVDACGASDSLVKKILVINPKGKPKARFAVNQRKGATSDLFELHDRSTNGPGLWRWEFSPSSYTIESGSDTMPRLEVSFAVADTYDVKLYVRNSLGADSLIKQDYITVFNYCVPLVTVQPPTTQLGISYFKLGDIEQSSSIGAQSYTNYTRTAGTALVRGARYPVTVARNSASPAMNVAIWIDYNQDGDFDDTLENALAWASASSMIFTDTLRVPSAVPYGQTRMRVGTSLGATTVTPCGPVAYGEFEDYRVVVGPDNVRPEITLLGSPTEFAEIGYPYVDAGATAYDNVDGDITHKIVTKNNVNNTKAGTYTVSYNVSDAVGNKALEVKRTVIMLGDQTKPTISLLGDNPMEMDVFTSFADPGATATDNVDGDVSGNIVVEVRIDTARLGQYEVIYSAFDNAGNFAEPVTRDVHVLDREAPIIVLRGSEKVVLKLKDTYVEDSADVTDNFYQDVDLVISGKVNTLVKGEYSVFYDATDRSGNTATQKVRTVVVEDNIGMDEGISPLDFRLFPNPGSDLVYLQLSGQEGFRGQVQVINALGQEMWRQKVALSAGVPWAMPISQLTPGIYHIEVVGVHGSVSLPLTVVR
jgi:PKD repeat protein